MSELIMAAIGFLVCSSIIIYYAKSKRQADDFYPVVLMSTLFAVLCFMLMFWSVQYMLAVKNGNFTIESGACSVTKFETSGRTHTEEIHVELDGEVFFGDFDDFEAARLGNYPCEIKYVKPTKSLYALEEQTE